MRVTLQLGGSGWQLELPTRELLEQEKFRAYVCEAVGPELVVCVDEGLAGEAPMPPRVSWEAGRLRFEGQGARWESDDSVQVVQARVAPGHRALERALAAWVCTRVVQQGGLMLHAGAVRTSRGAMLLLGTSGAGKSTATALAGERGLCSNAVIVRPQAAGFQVYTTPFTGAADRAPFERGPLPLAGMAVLRKAERAQAPQPLDGSALAVMAAAVVAQYPATAQYAAKVLESLSHLVGVCAVQILPFTKRELVLPE